jgi:hypothetical protein
VAPALRVSEVLLEVRVRDLVVLVATTVWKYLLVIGVAPVAILVGDGVAVGVGVVVGLIVGVGFAVGSGVAGALANFTS